MPRTYPEDSLLVGEGKNIFVTISFGGDLNEKNMQTCKKCTELLQMYKLIPHFTD